MVEKRGREQRKERLPGLGIPCKFLNEVVSTKKPSNQKQVGFLAVLSYVHPGSSVVRGTPLPSHGK